jgi:hypothetical protein
VDREGAIAAYERAWVEQDEDRIREVLAQCWTTDSTYVSPLTDTVRGVEGLASLILDFPVMFPGATMTHTSPPNVHHDVACYSWRLTSTARIRTMGRDFGLSLDGLDFVHFGEDGMINAITAFFTVENPAEQESEPGVLRRLNGGTVRSGSGGTMIDLNAGHSRVALG